MKYKIAVFASGSGTNAENLISYFSENPLAEVALIVASRPDAFVLERAKKWNIPGVVLTKKEFSDREQVESVLRKYDINFIVLAGFLLKVPSFLLESFPQAIVNIHPSLLPKHGGKGMYGDRVHQAVLDCGEKQSGITIHYVNDLYDAGQIIFQDICPVMPDDTCHTLAARVHALEYKHFPRVIAELLSKR